MKSNQLILTFALLAGILSASPIELKAEEQERPEGPVSGDNPNIGIKYDKAQGLFVTPFSAKLLGLEMADVDEQEITRTLTLQAQIFDTTPVGSALASAWLPSVDAALLSSGLTAELEENQIGKVQAMTSQINDQSEVILSIEDPKNELKTGKFLTALLRLPSDGPVTVVPSDTVIKSAEGAFAYVDNGGWTVRTSVEIGTEADGMIEIIDGLYFGDRIVTKPVMALWMTELQLLKSGKA